jgi:hypothetical protein
MLHTYCFDNDTPGKKSEVSVRGKQPSLMFVSKGKSLLLREASVDSSRSEIVKHSDVSPGANVI